MRYKIFILLLLMLVIPVASATSSFGNYTGVSWTLDAFATGITMNDDYFWITCTEENTGVRKYHNNGTYIGFDFNTKYNGNGQPVDITMNESYFWVLDRGDDLVYIYYSNGTYTNNTWDIAACGNGDPYGIDKNDTYFLITDDVDDEVYFYHLNGTSAGISFDTAACGNNDPYGIVIGSSYIWVTDDVNDKVYQYYPNGTYVAVSGSITSHPRGIEKNENYFWVIYDLGPGFKVYQYYASNVPTIPVLISPSNNSIQQSSPVTLDVLSTDTDGDPITYYYYGGTSPTSMSFIGTNDTGGSSFNWSIYDCDTYYWTAHANDSTGSSDNMATVQFIAIVPPQSTTNLLSNGSFENWSSGPAAAPDSWVLHNGPVARESAQVESGIYSAKLSTPVGTSYLSQYQNVSIGSTYTLGTWIETSDTSVQIAIQEVGLDYTSYWSGFHTGSGSWEFLTRTMTVPGDWVKASNILHISGTGESAYFDSAILVEGLEAAILPSPANGSTIYSSYPPLTYDIAFDWQDTSTAQYRIQVATDVGFNMLVVDTHVATHDSIQSLSVDDTYYWRVYAYDGTYYSNASDTWSFSIEGSTTEDGTAGIQGVVTDEEGVSIDSVTITCYNATWSDTLETGSNGYYLFSGLVNNSLYYITAEKYEYASQSGIPVTTGNGTWVTQNIVLIRDLPDNWEKHYVRFTVMAHNGTVYPGTEVIVYRGESLDVTSSGVTGTDGTIAFWMYQEVKYRITFTNTDPVFSKMIYLYPIDSNYQIVVLQPSEYVYNNITYDLDITNETITFTWTDPDSEANWFDMKVTNSTGNVQTNHSSGTAGIFTFNILNQSDDYCVNITIDTKNFGQLYLERCTSPGREPIGLEELSNWFKNIVSMFIIVVIALLFGRSAIGIGAIMVSCVVTFLWYISWLPGFNPVLIPIIFAFAIGISIMESRVR